MVKDNVIQIIHDAFKGVSRTGGVSLHDAWKKEYFGVDEVMERANAVEIDTHWWEVSNEDLEFISSAIYFFDPIGFRYYIPAYMIWHLRYDQVRVSNLSITYLFDMESRPIQLDLQGSGLEEHQEFFNQIEQRAIKDQNKMRQHRLYQFSLLDRPQRKACAIFLTYIADHSDDLAREDVRLYLKDYWDQYLQ